MGENGGKNKKKKHQKILWSIDMVLALFNFKAISFLGEFQVGKSIYAKWWNPTSVVIYVLRFL